MLAYYLVDKYRNTVVLPNLRLRCIVRIRDDVLRGPGGRGAGTQIVYPGTPFVVYSHTRTVGRGI